MSDAKFFMQSQSAPYWQTLVDAIGDDSFIVASIDQGIVELNSNGLQSRFHTNCKNVAEANISSNKDFFRSDKEESECQRPFNRSTG